MAGGMGEPASGAAAERVVNPLPWAVWLLVGAMALIEAVMALVDLAGAPAGMGGRLWALERFAYAAEVQEFMLANRVASATMLWRYLSFSFIQPATLPALLVLAMLAALGKQVAEGIGNAGFLLVALLGPVIAAFAYGLLRGADPDAWLAGGFTMAFALVGAFTWLLWDRARAVPARQWRAFGMIGGLLGARLAMGLMVEAGPGWIADLAGFCAGFALAVLLHPEGRARLIAAARGRG